MQRATEPRPRRVAIVGGTFSGNKGAASMLQAVIDRLPERIGPCEFAVLTAYPDDDAREAPPADGVRLVAADPATVLKMVLPALVGAAAGLLGLRWRPRGPAALRELRGADVVVDVSGISFVDGRPVPVLVYNVLLMALPLLVGTPVVKGAQALGPFERPLNRMAARAVLPRLAHICARGEATARHLEGLGLQNFTRADDLAFLLAGHEEAGDLAARLWASAGEAERVAVVPSAVVEGYARERGIDYTATMARFVDALAETGAHVLMLPHSARTGRKASRMNDLPVSRAIHARVTATACDLVEEPLTAHELRAVIGASDLLVTARFHAMISGLATATPLLVTGWSHKYAEVLLEFGLERFVLPYDRLSVEELLGLLDELRGDRVAVVAAVERSLPLVQERAMRNLDAVAGAVGG